MKTTITAQQTAFFTQNGFIEFEVPHEILFPLIHRSAGRDIWRHEVLLQNFLIRKLAPIALTLAGKKQLHLGCDQWISAENRPKKACAIKELFSIQGFAIGVVLAENPVIPARRSPLGILPLPTTPGHVLF